MKGYTIKSGDKRPTKKGAGMTAKGVARYRRENPGSKLQTAVTGKVKKGSKVKAGDTLVIIEAMKMEHSIKATETGKIAKVMIQLNDQVDNGATLLVLEQ